MKGNVLTAHYNILQLFLRLRQTNLFTNSQSHPRPAHDLPQTRLPVPLSLTRVRKRAGPGRLSARKYNPCGAGGTCGRLAQDGGSRPNTILLGAGRARHRPAGRPAGGPPPSTITVRTGGGCRRPARVGGPAQVQSLCSLAAHRTFTSVPSEQTAPSLVFPREKGDLH